MYTIKDSVCSEIEVKKSKFISNAFQVNSKNEAEEKIKEISKKYYDAKHNCYGYVTENYEKCSDDGEPSKTAGMPILEVIKKNNLQNVLIIVTRYFGGILLGTGGLTRAYSSAAKQVLEKAKVINRVKGIRYSIKINYGMQKDVTYLCKKFEINIVDTIYDNFVEMILESTIENKEKLLKNIKLEENCKIENDNIYIEKENS